MNRALRGKMARAGVYWDRYQTEVDYKLFQVCLKLKRAKLIHEVIVDRHHQTNVIVTRDDGAIPVLHPSDLIDLFTAAQLNQVNPFVQEIFADPEASENVINVESAGSRSTSTAVPDYPRSSLGDYLNDEVLVATAALRAAENENAASNDTVVHEDVENEATMDT